LVSPSGSGTVFFLFYLFYLFLCVISIFFGTGGVGQVRRPPSKIASDRLFLVEADHEGRDHAFFSSIPEAVSQAVAHITSVKYVNTTCFSFVIYHLSITFQPSRVPFLSIRWAVMDVFHLEEVARQQTDIL
jgi:hypothetical protein